MKILLESDLTTPLIQELIQEHGNASDAVRHLLSIYTVLGRLDKPLTFNTLRRIFRQKFKPSITQREDESRESRIEKLLQNHNVALDSIKEIKDVKIGIWGIHAKDSEGNIQTSYLDKTQITLTPHAPTFPIVDKANPTIIKYNNDVPKLLRKTWQAAVISDIQAGYLKNMQTGLLQPIHDPKAVSVALQITSDICPKKLVFIGDVSDWSFISRWEFHNEFDAVNESIEISHKILADFISAAGPQVDQKRMIDSNHALRPEKFLLEHNRAAMQIKRASDTSKWPVFSEAYLLRYEDLGIEMEGRYPGGEWFMLPKLVFMHAPPKSKEFSASVIHGHTHKSQSTPRVTHTHTGREEFFTYDVGCLTSVGKNANNLSLMVTNTPSNQGRTNWNQGMAIVNVVEGKEEVFTVDLIQIREGGALYGGSYYTAKSEAD